jgi:hypothetical protein
VSAAAAIILFFKKTPSRAEGGITGLFRRGLTLHKVRPSSEVGYFSELKEAT